MRIRAIFSIVLFTISIALLQLSPKHVNAIETARKSIRIIQAANELSYPPFSIARDDGSADGFSVELLSAVAKTVGLDVNYKVGLWHEIKEELINGQLDALPLVSYSEERDEQMDFTTPYLRMHGAIFVRKGVSSVKTEADLKNKQVIVMQGDTAHEYAVKNNLSENLVLTGSYEEAMKMLSAGECDAVIVQYLVGLQLIKALGITNVVSVNSINETSLKPTSEPLSGFEQKFCIAVQEGDHDLQALLNEGLALVISSGQYNQLYDKWFGPILPERPISLARMQKYLLSIILPFIALTLIIGIWLLKKEVARKTRALKEQVAISEAAKLALQTSEKRLKTLINTLPDLIWLKDTVGNYLSCNGRFERFFGAKEEDIIGKTDYDFVDRELADFFRKNDQMAIDKGRPSKNEEEVVFADDGHHEILETIKTPMYGANGELVGVLGIGRDITGRRQTEYQLQESLNLLNSLAKLVPGVLYQYRLYPDGRSAFPYSSPGMYDIYGVTPEEVRDDASVVFGRLHPEDHDGVSDTILESARTLNKFYCEFRVILPGQGLRWRWSQANPQRMEDGGTLWHGIIIDITDRKLAEEEQAKLREQLQQAQKMESIGRLAGGVAHDYNNMLSIILGYADLALERISPSDSFHAYFTEIYKAARHSADITRQLLAFARKQAIVPKVVDLNSLIESTLKMLRRLIGENIDLDWKPFKKLWRIKVDPVQIDQILANLCVNARDAINSVGRIVIETNNAEFDEMYCATHDGALPGDYVMLAISDSGSGMDKETMRDIFEPFFTTKDIDKGTGLGLATIFGIVKQNKGFINVYSELGKGTTFKIYLPRYDGDAQERISEKSMQKPSGKGEIVLLVEDEPAISKMAQSMLKRLGYTVLVADTPGEAIIIANENAHTIDLLLSDVVMPEMNGRELSNQIKKICPDLKLLFMSGYTENVIANHGVVEEGTNFIQKPFSMKDLGEKIRFLMHT